MWTVAQLSADLASGKTTSRALVEQALERIGKPDGEGARAFMQVDADSTRAEADHADRLRKAGARRSPVDGLPVSIKDLFDIAGQLTRAGSKVYAAKAGADAVAVARLRAAGAIFIGRTNMVEFAFGGVGTNPHYGTPKNPWDRKTGRVPGGSSSGAAVSVADGMCVMGLGSDTRGSVRGPAALCGVTGFKPTQRRVPLDGAFPLSFTLDSIGPLANSVACCAAYDAVLSADAEPLIEIAAKGLRLLVPRSSAIEDLDADVAKAFQSALSKLSAAGAIVSEVAMPAFDRQAEFFKGGGFAGAEAYYIHRERLERVAEFDPRVGKRVLLGKELSGADYVALQFLRKAYQEEVGARVAGYDAFVLPSAPCVAPTIAEVSASEDDYFRWNMRLLRNHGLLNFLDGCGISLPCQASGGAPVGFSVCGTAMSDRRILAVAAAVERVLSRG
jgi:aspartyl-tRNA(Asn)/glutamyl-tRNA(Gln) amidotransferase subunit A